MLWLVWAGVVATAVADQTARTWRDGVATQYPRWFQPSNVTNPKFVGMTERTCHRYSVSAWGSSNSGGSGVPGDVTDPSDGSEVVAIASTRWAFAALKADG